MSVRGDKAYELFLSGYNCTQAVVGAFADVIGVDFDTAVRFASGFGGGMGRLREVCGTFSGAVIVGECALRLLRPEKCPGKGGTLFPYTGVCGSVPQGQRQHYLQGAARAFQTGRLANTGSKNGRVLQEASLSGALPIFSEHA